MPFPFTLPTTSSVPLNDFLASPSHPSLPLEATTKRSVLKDALKKYKRLPPQSRGSGLSAVQDAVTNYIPYLLALSTGAGCLDVGTERVDVEVLKPLTVEWRTTISASIPGREAPRPKLTGLHLEIAFVFSTLAYTYTLLARQQISSLHGSTSSPDQRTAAVSAAMKHVLDAYNIHTYLLTIPSISAAKDAPPDLEPSTISALASLALAEAWLIVVSKDDPYAAAVAEDRDQNNKDWMFKAPTIPKVRAHLYARLCLAAAEHAATASGLLSSAKIDDDLTKYIADLRRTARGKAARFLAIDADLSSQTGTALAWLRGARNELGFSPEQSASSNRKGFKGLKHTLQEKREDRRAEKGKADWGLDAGRLEEARVVEMLEAKWERENSAVNVQLVPAWEPLLASMPSGRDYPKPEAYQPPVLDAGVLARLRAPVEEGQRGWVGEEADSGDEMGGGGYGGATGAPVGAFPGSEGDYGIGRSGTSSSYY